MLPFFSIIIPAYNVENYIGRAITSILNQSFKDYEIIIVNDGSVDKTMDIINEYAKNNKKINIVNHIKNESQHVARIDGIAASSGQYIAFLDADDWYNDHALTILFNEIQINPENDFYEFGYILNPTGEVVLPSFQGEDRFTAYFRKEKYPVYTLWNKVYNAIFLKKTVESLERTYINIAEDMYTSIVISYYAKKIYIINKIIINYSVGTGISTTYKDYNQTLNFLNSVKKSIMHIQKFLEKTEQNINLDNLNYRFLSNTINWYINTQKNIEDKEKLFLQLPDFFDIKIIMKYLFSREESYYKSSIISISKEYKLGKILLYPLRKIKQYLNVNRKNIKKNI